MGKKMLRSVLAAAVSAALAAGVLGTLDLAWDSAPNKTAGAQVRAVAPPDLAWDSIPADLAEA
ncbi:hypothetical protein ACFU6I_33080 [Streptomyces sp. NPDC057486]|uniref:hypothetical protein n=1 Tax=Streptomyces sp. NPDC057486 TaxID=3346145 RepID=UPI0036C324B2